MSTTNKDRDVIISKNVHISNTCFESDLDEATKWTLDHIESTDFQSENTKIELNVYTLRRNYMIWLYRNWDSMQVWIDWNFAYEVELNWWWLGRTVKALFRNWRWVPGIEMIYRWDWCDPQLFRNWIKANYREVEDYLYEEFIDWLKDSNKYDEFIKLKSSKQDQQFNDWLLDHYYRIVEIFLMIR